MAKYNVVVAGGNNRALFKGNDLAQAKHMRIRWAIQLKTLQVDVILVDMETGEILAM